MIEKAKTKTAVFNKGATTGVKAAVYGGAAVAGLALAGGVVSAVRGGKKRENERRSRY